jgi:hypothetical protein
MLEAALLASQTGLIETGNRRGGDRLSTRIALQTGFKIYDHIDDGRYGLDFRDMDFPWRD